jgi:hypothetical protein
VKKSLKAIGIALLCLIVVFSLAGCTAVQNEADADIEAENNVGAGYSNPSQPVSNNGSTPVDQGRDEHSSVSFGQVGEDANQGNLKQWDGVKGKILTDNYPLEIIKYLETNKKKETQQAFNINNRTYLVMTMGQQGSAGYFIELKELVFKEGVLKASIKYNRPGKNDMVATVITYPSLVIETDGIYEGHYLIEYDIEH